MVLAAVPRCVLVVVPTVRHGPTMKKHMIVVTTMKDISVARNIFMPMPMQGSMIRSKLGRLLTRLTKLTTTPANVPIILLNVVLTTMVMVRLTRPFRTRNLPKFPTSLSLPPGRGGFVFGEGCAIICLVSQ